MLKIFPDFISRKAILWYFATLLVVTLIFMQHSTSLLWMLFGTVEVVAFFYFSNVLTKKWQNISSKSFERQILWTSLLIRVLYVFFSYFFYQYMTGQPFMFYSADEQSYYYYSKLWREYDFKTFVDQMIYIGFSDTGEMYWTAFLCKIFGPYVFPVRIGHAVLSAFTCVLIYRIAHRHFEEPVARIAAVFCMLMPNLIYYCGTHLKEADMVFLIVFFIDRIDIILTDNKINFANLIIAVLSAIALFTFRTALGAVALLSVIVAIMFNKGQLGSWWKRIVLVLVVSIGLFGTSVGNRIMGEATELWETKETNQSDSMEWRSQRVGGNTLVKNLSGAVFAPLIFTIPFPTMVNVDGQENQQMIHGGNFVKNILSGFVIFALFTMLFSGEWRKRTLLIAFMCGYLVVIAFSAFAHSERFHQPALPFELMFAAWGVTQLKPKQVRWLNMWMVFIFVANIFWAWFKLKGRGLV